MPNKISLLLLSMALCSCAHIKNDPAASKTEPSSFLSLPKRLIGLEPKQELSPWHKESLALCFIQGNELEEFELPVVVNLWDRIRDGFGLDAQMNPRIQQEIHWYSKHPSYMERVSERAQRYLHFVVQELDKRQLPMELALLPIVESAFDPFAYSHGQAAGMWQIIPGTGRSLGLKQNWWYDGRRDVVESTHAALNYLEKLYRQLNNDWMLALAAYNSGAGNVQKAIRKNQAKGKPTDYWSLDLPRETSMYVPRLLALKALLEKPESYGISFYPIEDQPYFLEVDVGSQIDLAQAANWAEISMEELASLNPGFNRWATDPEGPYRLLFPVENAGIFIEKLAASDATQRVVWDRHQIKNGETLSTIAKQYRTTVEFLQSINDISGHNIRAGKTLMVPKSAGNPEHYSQSATERLKRTQSKGKGNKIEYTVKSGDSLWEISRKYKVSTQQIARWNGMAPKDTIRPGQTLVIWQQNIQGTKSQSPAGSRAVRKVAYKVRKGDSLAAIASKFKVRVSDIVEWNKVNPSKHLQPGDRLTLFVDVTRLQGI